MTGDLHLSWSGEEAVLEWKLQELSGSSLGVVRTKPSPVGWVKVRMESGMEME